MSWLYYIKNKLNVEIENDRLNKEFNKIHIKDKISLLQHYKKKVTK